VVVFINYLNQTNRKLAFFLDSIKNDDTSITFQQDIKNKPVRELHQSMNKVNRYIQNYKIKAENREKLLQSFIEHSATAFVTIDKNGSFEVLNNNARKYLGVEHTADMKILKQIDSVLFDSFASIKPEETKTISIVRDDRRISLSVSLNEKIFSGQKFKLISMQNISHELDRREVETWQKLFKVITHEISNSIAPITSVSKSLSRHFSQKGSKKTAQEITDKIVNDTVNGLEVIEQMSQGLNNFVENYRKLSSIPQPEIKEVNIERWLNNLKILFIEILNEEQIKLSVQVAKSLDSIKMDDKLMNMVIINLIKNSVESLKDCKEKQINIFISSISRGKTTIKIEDNGKGIAKENLDQIFIPFYTTKEEGSGIGLSLSRQIVQMHGGNILVQSQLRRGTQFIIEI
jgi:nitrogen fixation/metabolism regulation signal transduction histidine kinase